MARRGSACLQATPWVPLLCLLMLGAGIPMWYMFSGAAANSTRELLASVSLGGSVVEHAASAFSILRTVALVLLLATLLLVALVALLSALLSLKRRRCPGSAGSGVLRSFMAADAGATTLLWLALVAIVVLLALLTTWFAAALAGQALLSRANDYSASAEAAAARAVDSVKGLVDSLQAQQLAALDAAPAEVKATPWFQGFRQGVENFNDTVWVAVGGGQPINATCAPGCVNLDFFSNLAGLPSSCVCISGTITTLQQGLDATRQNMVPALAGLVLLYLAATWLLINCTARYVHAKRDLRALRDYSGAPGYGGSKGAGYEPSRGPGLAASPGVDAAVDIHGGGSPGGGYKPPPPPPRGSSYHGGLAGRDQGYAAPAPSAPPAGEQFDVWSHSQLFGGERPVHGQGVRPPLRASDNGGAPVGTPSPPRPHRIVCVGDRDVVGAVPLAGPRASAPSGLPGSYA